MIETTTTTTMFNVGESTSTRIAMSVGRELTNILIFKSSISVAIQSWKHGSSVSSIEDRPTPRARTGMSVSPFVVENI